MSELVGGAGCVVLEVEVESGEARSHLLGSFCAHIKESGRRPDDCVPCLTCAPTYVRSTQVVF